MLSFFNTQFIFWLRTQPRNKIMKECFIASQERQKPIKFYIALTPFQIFQLLKCVN